MSNSSECVKVVIRCRPMSTKEQEDERQQVVVMNTNRGEVFLADPGNVSEQPRTFTFDSVYDQHSEQSNLYLQTAYPVVESVLEGYNGTIFAYGQTGTGKTFTMAGERTGDLRGVIPRAFEHVFQRIEVGGNKQFLVRASYLEIYNEEIRDLLAKNPKNRLELKEHPETGVYVKDLSAFVVKQVTEIQEIMDAGQKNRSVGETLMNQSSSRSHSIFTITVETSEYDDRGSNHIRVGKLNLVDLAGSERQSKTGATGDRLKEATKINLSLSALGNVISQLVAKSQHISYRDSKLTRLLQDSLGGNTKTVMIANLGPADYNFDETLSTLRYANRAKSIINKPKINEDPKDAMLRQFQEEINKLKAQLALIGDGQGGEMPIISDGGVIIQKEVVVEKIVKVQDEEKMKALEEKLEKQRQNLKTKAENDRKKIEEQKNLAEGEKSKLLLQLQEQEEKENKEREKQHKLLHKLKGMEEKLLVGTQAMETAMKQEIQLEKAHKSLHKNERRTEAMAEKLTNLEEEELMMKNQFTTIQEGIEEKTKKLKALWSKVQAVNTEVNDTADEYQREREQMVETIKELSRQLKLKNLVIDYFIPVPELMKLEKQAQWSEDRDCWVLPNLGYAGNSLAKQRAKLAKKAQASRMEEQESLIPPDSQLNVYYAYTEEGAIREEGAQPVAKKTRAKSAKNRPQTAKKSAKAEKSATSTVVATTTAAATTTTEEKPLYPKARGLNR